MQPEHPGMIAQTIQLALAPVFVLVAIGNIMNILTTRLGRMVDRSRHLQMLHAGTQGSEHDAVVIEMRTIDQRIAHIGRALLLLVLSGLAIGTTVAALFLSELAGTDLRLATAATFVLAIGLLMGALVLLLLETRLAARTLRLPPALLELERGDL
jgi:thiosulfate reductase cytochrome b subunit